MNARHFSRFTDEGLAAAKQIIEQVEERGGTARIDTTWLDKGADWAWETIIAKSPALNMDFQALHPNEFDLMNEGRLPLYMQTDIVQRIVKD